MNYLIDRYWEEKHQLDAEAKRRKRRLIAKRIKMCNDKYEFHRWIGDKKSVDCICGGRYKIYSWKQHKETGKHKLFCEGL